MWELDYKESWAPKSWCFWTAVLEKTLENPLDSKKIQPVHPKGNQSWMFIWRTDAEAETPIFWPPMWPKLTHWKDRDAGKDWRQDVKGATDNEVVGWHHWLNWHEFEQAPGVGDGQKSLACCSPWDRKESDMTEWLDWTEVNWTVRNKYLLLKLPCLWCFVAAAKQTKALIFPQRFSGPRKSVLTLDYFTLWLEEQVCVFLPWQLVRRAGAGPSEYAWVQITRLNSLTQHT